ncbi:DUF3159 domain-containing protein [Curtobacterium sp. MCBD17_034]|uniref:DUF3159 domain-containing protein n=1 Tax=unclassified Curtobacterium TaxID=257496 RepID=UPI000DA7F7E5|nr:MULTISPECIES: DUF3159 domain-containing protein [unclassified Curtobacterium]PZF60862.1 DUF3159 domain-containing protein [Curtobacterium sp. MCBD17_034]PZF66401.1 DUF3159 domain-containing protein [Curtobacterium sp. MCBD17_013]PZM40211.1 DUF3159 domain-containing protein [Curtobacterium sp. MCBD17_031]WIB64977.1 DUF3159 domain-containing protein [Curtobacterium sp. MCBD17_040]WIB68838.1 DUF3159 domain-containing protein [Curtobacterium sp. MCBD17_035]
MTSDPSAPLPEDHATDHADALSLSAQLRDAVARAGIARVAPGEAPSGRALVAAVGGVRGLAESILPGFAFLIVFAVTHQLVPSVVVPVLVGLVFVGLRLVQRQPLVTALSGILGVAISAGLSLFTGRAESNFVPGIVVNAVSLAVLLATLVARRPLIGIVVGLLLPEGDHWRSDPGKRRVLTVATWLWAGLFAVRLAIEVPLYLAAQVELLAGIKLVTGVPLYAAMLWVTWLLVRSVFGQVADGGTGDVDAAGGPDRV